MSWPDMSMAQTLEAIPLAMIHIDAQSRVAAINAPARRLFGDMALGQHYISVLRQPALLDRIESVMRLGEKGQVRYLTTEAGRDLVYEVTIAPLEAPHEGYLLTFEDATSFEEAREMRSDFVANVSHELRSPLTALSGFIETLQGPASEDTEARKNFLEIMERETWRMNRLVNDLLSLSRVEDQARQRPTKPVDLCAIVKEALVAIGPAAQERDVRFETETSAQELILPGDREQLRQVVSNLLENAVKYGRSPGTVTIRILARDHLPSLRGAGVLLSVEDEGEGISDRHLGRLTERFYRIDSHRSRDMGGTGLGLAIVKHVVNRHRGRLRITSTPGKGSVFTVMLPLG